VTTYPCAECGELYEQAVRRATAYCPACRRERALAKQRERDRARRARREDIVDVLNDYTSRGMSADYVAMMHERLDGDGALIDPADDWKASPLPPLTGANTPAGPDEGTSTFFVELREELEYHADGVAGHEWWRANPNWWVGIHDGASAPDTTRLSAA
jgi:DNA-directed RNA polymerase subunit RPC12/RpoP